MASRSLPRAARPRTPAPLSRAASPGGSDAFASSCARWCAARGVAWPWWRVRVYRECAPTLGAHRREKSKMCVFSQLSYLVVSSGDARGVCYAFYFMCVDSSVLKTRHRAHFGDHHFMG